MAPYDVEYVMVASPAGEARFVIAIDLGTTFSGSAFGYGEGKVDPNTIKIITSWPGGSGGASSAKTPTVVTYSADKQTIAKWGYKVRESDGGSIRGIKLLLDPSQALPEWMDKKAIQGQLKAVRKTPVQVTADFLRKIYEHAIESLWQHNRRSLYMDTAIHVVITVPAIWSDKAKDATLQAAKRAGLPNDRKLKIVAEPEAAAIYALSTMRVLPKPGEVLICCDMGGGTTDVSVYRVKQHDPLRIEEFVTGDGALCGGFHVNAAFEKDVLKARLDEHTFNKIRYERPEVWATLSEAFENYKCRFDPEDHPDYLELEYLPLPGIPDDPARLIKNAYIQVSSREMRKLFDPIIQKIVGVVNKVRLEAIRKGVAPTLCITCGGFAQSHYVFKSLRRQLMAPHPAMTAGAASMDVIKLEETWTAVQRGAVLRGLSDYDMIVSRRAKRHYGTVCDPYFDGKVHPDESWFKDELGFDRAAEQLDWLIERDQVIHSGRAVVAVYHRHVVDKLPAFFEAQLHYCNEEVPPTELNETVHPLCTLRIDCSSIPIGDGGWIAKRELGGAPYWTLFYELGIYVESGCMKFDARINGKVHATVVAEFE